MNKNDLKMQVNLYLKKKNSVLLFQMQKIFNSNKVLYQKPMQDGSIPHLIVMHIDTLDMLELYNSIKTLHPDDTVVIEILEKQRHKFYLINT